VVPFALVLLVAATLVQIVVKWHFVYQKEGKEEQY